MKDRKASQDIVRDGERRWNNIQRRGHHRQRTALANQKILLHADGLKSINNDQITICPNQELNHAPY